MKKTFEYDDKLPALPLPTLEHTLERYLDSVRAVVDDNEYANTKKVVERFAKGIGRELHEQLKTNIEKRQERNWLSKWWDEEIYLKWRLPIAPTISMTGFNCLVPPETDSQLTRICVHMYACALVFETIREERYPISYVGKHPLTMHQYKHFFNTCRIPHKGCDELMSVFRTVSEDPRRPPTHVVVMRNGHMFMFDLYESNKLLTPPEILKRLEDIVQQSDQSPGLGLGALTALPRDEWTKVRDHLYEMNEQNKINFQRIEQALLVYGFDNENAENLTEHSAYEGSIPVHIGDYIQNHIDTLEKIDSWPIPSDPDNKIIVHELLFIYDSHVLNAINHAINLFHQLAENIDIIVTNVNQCTKEDIKQYVRIHPDTYFQLCLQLAYFKLHGNKPASTYETASTRRFYRGRTETVRTCSPEVVAWCRAMESERRKLFLIAANRHQELMNAASKNQGCDRHLFALSMMATLTGKPFDLINDPSWIKRFRKTNKILFLLRYCFGF
ncbi:unnamed protein product [Rotaria magnacalcarata]|uniref:Choline/carnitine acyltransferase domain-containing protein n=1 Tax=Rotaria magnacalcarata TaxID=392030 RepID=A0A816TLM9_9BILA|nr:unnamed protein product [Rotaria magnacalcarata]